MSRKENENREGDSKKYGKVFAKNKVRVVEKIVVPEDTSKDTSKDSSDNSPPDKKA